MGHNFAKPLLTEILPIDEEHINWRVSRRWNFSDILEHIIINVVSAIFKNNSKLIFKLVLVLFNY